MILLAVSRRFTHPFGCTGHARLRSLDKRIFIWLELGFASTSTAEALFALLKSNAFHVKLAEPIIVYENIEMLSTRLCFGFFFCQVKKIFHSQHFMIPLSSPIHTASDQRFFLFLVTTV